MRSAGQLDRENVFVVLNNYRKTSVLKFGFFSKKKGENSSHLCVVSAYVEFV